MILSFKNKNYTIELGDPLDLSIPLLFNGDQPNSYNVPQASSKPCEAEGIIGDTRQGGSCNFEEYRFIPHCNGTHTECIGHITDQRISISDCLKDVFIPASLISVATRRASDTPDTYTPPKNEDDLIISLNSLKNSLKAIENEWLEALIIRSLPNDDSKKSRRYMEHPAPYFSHEAMRYIAEKGVKHLLVDMPSIDRAFDDGMLSNHRIFWNIPPGSKEINDNSRTRNTITEMIYAPSSVPDGCYLLNLQIPPFASDAAPSRPLIFKVSQ